MRIVFLATALVTVTAGLSARADSVTIASLARDTLIAIEGTVTEVAGSGFVLTDGTGAVRVDTGPGWFHDLDLSEGETLRVTGEPDADGFDAFTLERGDGTVLTIRPAEGPPPWAGARRDG